MSIFLLIILLFLFYLTGATIKYILKIDSLFSLHIGFFTNISIFHIIGIIPILFNVSFNNFFWGVSSFFVIGYLFIIYIYLNKKIYLTKYAKIKLDSFNCVTLLISLVVILLYLLYYTLPSFGSDQATYIPLIRDNILNNQIYLTNPTNGYFPSKDLGIMYQIVSFEVFLSVISYVTQMDALYLVLYFIGPLSYILFWITSGEIVNVLFRNNKDKIISVVIIFILFLISFEKHGIFYPLNMFKLYTMPFAGKTILIYSVLPFSIYIISKYIVLKDNKILIALCITNFAGVGLSAISLFTSGIVNFVFVCYLLINKRIKRDNYNYLILVLIPFIVLITTLLTKINLLIALIFILIFIIIIMNVKSYILKYSDELCKIVKYIYLIPLLISSFLMMRLPKSKGYNFYINETDFFQRLNDAFERNISLFLLIFFAVIFIIFQKKIRQSLNEVENFIYYFLPISIITIFFNPFTAPAISGFITTPATYHRVIYTIPFIYMVIYFIIYFINKVNYIKYLSVAFLLIIFLLNIKNIYYYKYGTYYYDNSPMGVLKNENIDILSRVDIETYQLATYFNGIGEDSLVFVPFQQMGLRMFSSNVKLLVTEIQYRNFSEYLEHQHRSELENLYWLLVEQNESYNDYEKDYYHSYMMEKDVDFVVTNKLAASNESILKNYPIIFQTDNYFVYKIKQ